MGRLDPFVGRLVESNNQRIHAASPRGDNPLDLDGIGWVADVERCHPAIRDEWTAFVDGGGRLPLIEDLISESQGNEGPWRSGLLFHEGRPVAPLALEFPATLEALSQIPGLRSALFSLLEPGTELPEHRGPNAGVLRYHLGVSCPPGASLRVGNRVVRYRDGESVLFDDTELHSAWNRGDAQRVTLFCQVDRPLSGRAALANAAVQKVLGLDHRYRAAPARAAAWHHALNRPTAGCASDRKL